MSSSTEKADLLFKASLGFPSTNKDYEFFQESAAPNNYVLGEEIFVDDIPDNPIFAGGAKVTYTLASTSSTVDASVNSTGTVAKIENLPLTFIPNSVESTATSGAWYCLDTSGNNILQDALQFNYKKDASGNQPYLYSLYDLIELH